MPRSWFGSRPTRGASAPEYAIGAAVLAVALIGGMQAVESAADQRYDDEQAVVGTPVTDLSGAPSTTAGATSTTATIPPAVTTSTTLAATTTTVQATTTTRPTLSLTAQGVAGSGTNWSITFTVSSSAATGAITATAATSGQVGTCNLTGGSCTGTIGGLKRQDGAQTVTASAPGFTSSAAVPVAVPA